MPIYEERDLFLGDDDKVRIFDSNWAQANDIEWASWLRIPFRDAAAEGDLDFMQKLLSAGACVGDAILPAVLGGHERVVDELLALGASVTLIDGYGNTPVHLAVVGGKDHILRSLLQYGALMDEENNRGHRPIHLAAIRGNLGATTALLAAGANVNNRRSGLESPLDFAVTSTRSRRNVRVVKALLEHGADVGASDTVGRTALHRAARSNFVGAIDAVVEAGAEIDGINFSGETSLHVAARAGHPEAVVALLDHGADIILHKTPYAKFGEHSALAVAAKFGHVDTLKAIVEYGAGVNVTEVPNPSGTTTLHNAATYNQEGAVTALVEMGAPVDVPGLDGETPLHVASRSHSRDAVVALLDHGAAVNARADDNQSPLHKAVVMSRADSAAETVDILLRRGADETAVDAEGRTAARLVVRYPTQRQEESGHHGIKFDRNLSDNAIVAKLLANAPADRAWRRRGLLVLCRAIPDKAPLRRNGGEATVGTVTCAVVSGRANLARTGTGGVDLHSATVDEGGGRGNEAAGYLDPFAALLAWVVRSKEEGIFRTIVSFF